MSAPIQHAERCHTNFSGDRQCNCFLAYGFESEEAMGEWESAEKRRIAERYDKQYQPKPYGKGYKL